MTRSRKGYANELHQLLVSHSRHLYFDTRNFLHYQDKAITVSTSGDQRRRKEQVVYYMLIDKFSGNVFFSLTTSRHLFPLLEFLYAAWNLDERHDFFGLPREITIPKIITSPSLFSGLQSLGIEARNPGSGFEAGVRYVNLIEAEVWFNYRYYSLKSPAQLLKVEKRMQESWHILEEARYRWSYSLQERGYRPLPEQEEFLANFPREEELSPGLFLSTDNPCFQEKEVRNKLRSRSGLPPLKGTVKKDSLWKARDMIYDTWELYYRQDRQKMAKKALRICPYCADAYNTLAWASMDPREKVTLFNRARKVGKECLNAPFADSEISWYNIDARPYMRALLGLAMALEEMGRLQWAASLCAYLLEVNPHDNQGARYVLPDILLRLGETEKLEAFFQEFGDEHWAMMRYTKALYQFYCGDDEAVTTLHSAWEENPHMPKYLLGREFFYEAPAAYSPGHDDEARVYTKQMKKAWEEIPGALAWLKEKEIEFQCEERDTEG